ncbi:hypothetical protein TRFO_02564 [Tritrichomonas foetus]|uniref:Cullin family profile domain-containing protein n=1 Tax=Tritrichomonas foetus TaxID=1144522 RepID=A0A1J4L6E3_9EUKA|nr:hypothetical protein TRFO_02564 [Tritrichomonas foetus]|eukprot:OHT17518.1 hypothetical protein TRFO_02564 [Tritrichomonas foetus]
MLEVDSFLTKVLMHTRPGISFSKAYSIAFYAATSSPCDFLSYLSNKITIFFHTSIKSTIENDQITEVQKLVLIYDEYLYLKKTFLHLFAFLEKYSPYKSNVTSNETSNYTLSLLAFIDEIFQRIFKNLICFEHYCSAFLNHLEKFHFSNISENLEFDQLFKISRIYFLVFEDRNEEFIHLLNHSCENSAKFFAEYMKDSTPFEIVECFTKYLNDEKMLLNTLFNNLDFFVNSSLKLVYYIFNDLSSPHYSEISKQIKESSKIRDLSFIVDYFKLITINSVYEPPSEEILTAFSNCIHEQILQESLEIPDLGNVVSFYNELFETLNSPFLMSKYNRQITEFINKDNRKMIKDLILYINKVALTSNPNLSNILTVLRRIENKNEFEMIHSRHVTKRLLPLSEKQIEREKSIVSQIKTSSNSYEFVQLTKLLDEARKSIERHIGPVLVAHSSCWPFQQPFPRCKYFDEACKEISTKYKKLYPNRLITFPFDSWAVSVKDTYKNFTMAGNAVQGEVLLYLNEHPSISLDSLAPFITIEQLTPIIKSLASNKYPVLIESNINEKSIYKVNPKFKPKHAFIKLPVPGIAAKTVSKDTALAKNEAIDAAIIKLMKGNRSSPYTEVENRITIQLSDRYRIVPSEIRNRINSLISRNFLEMSETENEIIYVP